MNCLDNYSDTNYSVFFAVNSVGVVDGKDDDGVSLDTVDGKGYEIVGLRNAKLFMHES